MTKKIKLVIGVLIVFALVVFLLPVTRYKTSPYIPPVANPAPKPDLTVINDPIDPATSWKILTYNGPELVIRFSIEYPAEWLRIGCYLYPEGNDNPKDPKVITFCSGGRELPKLTSRKNYPAGEAQFYLYSDNPDRETIFFPGKLSIEVTNLNIKKYSTTIDGMLKTLRFN